MNCGDWRTEDRVRGFVVEAKKSLEDALGWRGTAGKVGEEIEFCSIECSIESFGSLIARVPKRSGPSCPFISSGIRQNVGGKETIEEDRDCAEPEEVEEEEEKERILLFGSEKRRTFVVVIGGRWYSTCEKDLEGESIETLD